MKEPEDLGIKIAVNKKQAALIRIKDALIDKIASDAIEIELNREMLIVVERKITEERETIK